MFYFKSNISWPSICIVACTHGNEIAGIKIFEELIKKGIDKQIKMGSLRLLVSNTEALKAYKSQDDLLQYRFINHDMNRIWNSPFIEGSVEYKRREDIKPMLLQADIILDIHSVSKGDAVLGIADKKSLSDAKEFMDVEKILVQSVESSSMTSWCAREGKLAFGIEAWNHVSDAGFQNGLRNVKNMLIHFWIVEGKIERNFNTPESLEFFKEIRIESNNFHYIKDFSGFTEIQPWELIAHDGSIEIRNNESLGLVLWLVRKELKKWDGAGFLFEKLTSTSEWPCQEGWKDKPNITLISSFSRDKIVKDDAVSYCLGWPAYFIEKAFKKEDIRIENISKANFFEIEIHTWSDWETGKVISKRSNRLQHQIDCENIIISTIMDEFKLSDVRHVKAKRLFIDLQWFCRIYKTIRDTRYFDQKELFVHATKKEYSNISKSFLEKLKRHHTLLVTDSRNDAFIYHKWQKKREKVEAINSLKDTVWAWDTFFANFICQYLQTWDVFLSTKRAIQQTHIFLLNKEHDILI